MTFAKFLPVRPLMAGLVALALAFAAQAQTAANPATPAAPAPATPAVPAPATPAPDPAPSGDASTAQALDLPARPVALLRGSAKWDEGFASITAAIAKINAEVAKAGLVANGHPITVFVETDDDGFRFETMVPLADVPAGKDSLSDVVKLGKSPPGKAIKFQHRGTYEEIDATYEAITAYLDEKGLEAQNLFIEEYLTEPKTADDAAMEVDIYVFVK